MFIAGTRVNNGQKNAFAAMVDSTGNMVWIKEFGQANTNTYGMLTAIVNDGFAVIVSSSAGNAMKNRMLLLDAAGNTKTTKDLTFSSVPQRLVYDDIADNFVLAFKGNSLIPFAASNDQLHICMLNARLENVWSKSLTFDGYVSNIVKTDDNYYIYGAYRSLTNASGRKYTTEVNRMNMFVYPINTRGNWLNVSVLNFPFSVYPLYVSKINNEYVDVISVIDEQADKLVEKKSANAKPHYMIIHANSNIYYQYSK